VADVMNDALAACLEAFTEHWGQKTLNALRALHALRYGDENYELEITKQRSPQGNYD